MKSGAFMIGVLCLSGCTPVEGQEARTTNERRGESFYDPDPAVSEKICMDTDGHVRSYPNTAIFVNEGGYIYVTNDINSGNYLSKVAPFGGLSPGECKRIPRFKRVVHWDYSAVVVYTDTSTGYDTFERPVRTPEEIEENRQLLEYWDLQKPGDASVEVDGKVWPRKGYDAR